MELLYCAGIALVYFIIVIGVSTWLPGFSAKDILSFVTPVVFYLLGRNSGKSRS